MAKRSTNGRQIHNNIGGKKYKMVDNNYYEIDLDIWKQSPLKKITTKQFDIGRKIRIKLFSNKFIYNISDSEIVFYMKKGNENIVFNKCNVIDKNIIEIEITSAMVENSGSYNIEIHILSDSISTFRFELIVVETIMDVNAVTSTSEYLALVNAYKEYNELRIKLNELTESINDIVANVTNGNESATNSEIVLARSSLTSLGDRLDKIEIGERIKEKSINYYHLADGIKDILKFKEKISVFKEEIGYLSAKGEKVTNQESTYRMQYYDISNLNYVIINGDLFKNASIYGLLSENDTLIEFKPVEDITFIDETIIDTKQAKYLIVNRQGDKKINVYEFKNIKDITLNLENKIEELNNKIPNEYIEIFSKKTEKGFLKSDGTINKNEASTYTMKYYDVENISEIKIIGEILTGVAKYGFVTSLNEVISYEKNYNNTNVNINTVIKVPKYAKYLIVTVKNNVLDIYKGLTVTNSFIEFKNKVENNIGNIYELTNSEKTEKGFLKSDGTISKNESSTYTLNYYNVENMSRVILKGTILKSSAYGFIDSNENVLDYESVSENIKINKTLNIPEGAKYLLVTTQTISGLTLEAYKNISVSEGVNNLKVNIEEIKSKIKSNYWEGKTIWLCGTSVPAGNGKQNTYPYMLSQILGCTVINQAVGGSSICCKEKTSSNWHNMPNDFSTAYRCFSNTLEEQEWVISQMAEGGLYEGKNMDTNAIRGMSYEKKLIPYLDGTYPCPDLFIIEHGPNDLRSLDKEIYDENNPYDLTNYYGAMNFIIKTIFEYQPQARVMMMGHYENQSPKRVIAEGQDDYGARTIAARGIVPTKQQKVAEIWNIPIYRTWEYMGWSQMKVQTKGKWVNGYWQENYYDEPVEMTMLAYNLPDQSHPHSDKSGKPNLKIAGSLAEFIENNIR